MEDKFALSLLVCPPNFDQVTLQLRQQYVSSYVNRRLALFAPLKGEFEAPNFFISFSFFFFLPPTPKFLSLFWETNISVLAMCLIAAISPKRVWADGMILALRQTHTHMIRVSQHQQHGIQSEIFVSFCLFIIRRVKCYCRFAKVAIRK